MSQSKKGHTFAPVLKRFRALTHHNMNNNTKQNIALVTFAVISIAFAFGLTACGVVTLY